MNAYILHDSRPTVEPLVAAFTREGLRPVLVSPSALRASGQRPDGVILNWLGARTGFTGAGPAHGSTRANEPARRVLDWLESPGGLDSLGGQSSAASSRPRVINGGAAFAADQSKLHQRELLRSAGIPIPRALAVAGDEVVRAARELSATPVVVRANRSRWNPAGAVGDSTRPGAPVFGSVDALAAYADGPLFEPSTDGLTLLQEHIAPAGPGARWTGGRPGLIRVHIVGGEYLHAVLVPQHRGSERIAGREIVRLSEGAPEEHQPLPEFDHPVIDRFIVLLRREGIDAASLDIVEDASGRLVGLGFTTVPEYSPAFGAGDPRSGPQALARLVAAELAERSQHAAPLVA